ncbi:MAG: hypothetical protein LC793_17665 [Thermomicrobia bacterium]|nr:hypothetical protein [Thermomicrobia bacterium]
MALVQASAPQSATNGQTEHREKLEAKYAGIIEERPHFRLLVTYVPNKDESIHRWFPYREGFSATLVRTLFNEFEAKPGRSVILDPFAGCGTTLVEASRFSCESWGVDMLPIAAFVARVKAQSLQRHNVAYLRERVQTLLGLPATQPIHRGPEDVRILQYAYAEPVLNDLLFLREQILLEPDTYTRDFLLLGLLSILEEISFTRKDGQYLRMIPGKYVPPVRAVLTRKYAEMLQDLDMPARNHQYSFFPHREQSSLFSHEDVAPVHVSLGDARVLRSHIHEGIDIAITSPPYLNRFDYSRTYSLELCLHFVENFAGLRDVRHSLLRSHIESKDAPTHRAQSAELDEILANLGAQELNNNRIPIMVRGYFEDMFHFVEQLAVVCNPGARIALVVGNTRFAGELIPVDLMLSELAGRVGFVTDRVIVTRYKGNSSQQMGRFGRIPVRESILFWRKP